MFDSEKAAKRVTFFIILVSVFSLYSCRFMLSLSGPIPIEYSKSSLTLSWDNDKTDIEGTPSATSYFDIFYRDLGATDWVLLQSTNDSENIVSIQYGNLGDGDYEFAVQAVYNNGEKSTLHCSTDFSAWPTGGWYLKWRVQ